jgi:hypothetical protein
MATPRKDSPEVRGRAVRMVREHGPDHPSQWAAITLIASEIPGAIHSSTRLDPGRHAVRRSC